MSNIKKLLEKDDEIFVFDIDGVLAYLEFGDFNHYEMDDEKWNEANLKGINFYDEKLVIKTMQEYLKNKDMSKIYACSKTYSLNEQKSKIDFLIKFYNFKKENIYFVKENNDKLNILFQIKNDLHINDEKQIAIVDDTVDILNYVMDNSNFATIHISSFLK